MSSVTPWKEFVEACDFVVGDFGEDPSEPGLWIDFVELGGFDQGVGYRGCFTSAFGAHEEIIFPAQGDTTN